jgi:hypothetical protein
MINLGLIHQYENPCVSGTVSFPNFKFRRTSLISSIVLLNTSSLRPVRLSKTGVGRSDSKGSQTVSHIGVVKKLMGKSTSSPIPPLQNEVTGEFVVNDEDKANLLNTFFCSISEIILIFIN